MTTPEIKSAVRAVADVGAGTIHAAVEIAVPPERVYRALTSPDEIPKWWGSDDMYWTKTWKSELRAGGKWRAEGLGADGTPFFVEGEYLELDPPKKIVCTWAAPWDGGNVTTITYRLEAIPGGTRLTLRHEGFADRVESCRGHADGWERVLGWMVGHVAPLPKAFFVCKLIPPRPSFAVDMTADEKAVMEEHGRYWAGHLQSGKALLFGPVGDPKGVWGLAVVRVADEAEARALQANDPAIRAERGMSYEVLPMLRAFLP